jgi:hypothetical protein
LFEGKELFRIEAPKVGPDLGKVRTFLVELGVSLDHPSKLDIPID